MKASFALFFLLPSLVFAQGYKSVFTEKKDVDADNVVYIPGRKFDYSVRITRNQESALLVRNAHDSWTWKKDLSDSLNRITMVVISPKKSKRTIKKQTEILYADLPQTGFIETTGLIENKNNIWLHPPRTGYYKSLELCPFPYVRLPLEDELTWTDEMTIGSQWAHPDWAVWKAT